MRLNRASVPVLLWTVSPLQELQEKKWKEGAQRRQAMRQEEVREREEAKKRRQEQEEWEQAMRRKIAAEEQQNEEFRRRQAEEKRSRAQASQHEHGTEPKAKMGMGTSEFRFSERPHVAQPSPPRHPHPSQSPQGGRRGRLKSTSTSSRNADLRSSSAELQAAKAAAMRQLIMLKQNPSKEARHKGFKELLRLWHPDKNPGSAEVATTVFQMIQAERGRPLPTPNAFEIAALTVGIMEESEQQGEPPSMAELLELLELVQAGMALLTRGRHSYNWQVTHWATDAAEEALALLTVATATDHAGELQQVQPDVGDTLPRLRNLLDEAATGVGVLVGIYPHRGEAEQVHPADAIAQQEDRHQQLQHPHRDPPDALHIYKAQRHLRQLVPFLDGDMRELGNQALIHLGDWIQSHWGEPVQLLSSDDETSQPQQGRPAPPAAHNGAAEGSTTKPPVSQGAVGGRMAPSALEQITTKMVQNSGSLLSQVVSSSSFRIMQDLVRHFKQLLLPAAQIPCGRTVADSLFAALLDRKLSAAVVAVVGFGSRILALLDSGIWSLQRLQCSEFVFWCSPGTGLLLIFSHCMADTTEHVAAFLKAEPGKLVQTQ
ncbi:hypothetical protein AK812_SmicGene26645 [Symbiodinium microadriaticum]|uniref:J domain-containing protein n=1 Tax=Symbiodinium microadriaticum TaxID=2951 RepID=A0A1Q9D903_SYMMI|nr:hypothetical protein AK812_SmicGene26645 [Symbiodinium microadriaticum]